MLASASRDMTVSLIDIRADEVIYSEYTEDYSKSLHECYFLNDLFEFCLVEAMSVCFVE